MKKNLMLLALAGMSMAAYAQSGSESFEKAGHHHDKYRVVTNKFWDNWFISAGGGATVMFGDNDSQGKFGKRISSSVNFAVGKWFTPGLGLRLQYSGLQARGFSTYDDGSNYVRGGIQPDGLYKQRFYYMNLHADAMFNLNALFGGYNEKRVYEIIPYVGTGFTHAYNAPNADGLAFNVGILNRFRVSKALDINLELSGVVTEDGFDGEVGGRGVDGLVSVTAGLTYRFPRRTFHKPVAPKSNEGELDRMRARIARMAEERNSMRDALADKNRELEALRNRPVEKDTVTIAPEGLVVGPRTIFFELGSAKISQRSGMAISVLADEIKKSSDTQKYVVKGYADSTTGSATVNQAISQKRADAVVDELVKKYGIDASRLSTEAVGGVNKFGPDILNRIAIVEPAQ